MDMLGIEPKQILSHGVMISPSLNSRLSFPRDSHIYVQAQTLKWPAFPTLYPPKGQPGALGLSPS